MGADLATKWSPYIVATEASRYYAYYGAASDFSTSYVLRPDGGALGWECYSPPNGTSTRLDPLSRYYVDATTGAPQCGFYPGEQRPAGARMCVKARMF